MFQQQTTNFDLNALKVLFSYENISSNIQVCDNDITFGSHKEPETDFIKFGYIGEDLHFRPTNNNPGGWKLHIAINDSVNQGVEVARAWNIILDILIEQRISMSKVIKPGVFLTHKDKAQAGKQITIYQFFNPNRDWNLIINQIESRLRDSNIAQGQFSLTDRPISQSRYISYRNDLTQDGKHSMLYQTAMQYPESIRFNPFGKEDPFVNFICSDPEPHTNLDMT